MAKKVIINPAPVKEDKKEEAKPTVQIAELNALKTGTLFEANTKLLKSYIDTLIKIPRVEFLLIMIKDGNLIIAVIIPSEIIVSVVYKKPTNDFNYNAKKDAYVFLNPKDTDKRMKLWFNERTSLSVNEKGIITYESGKGNTQVFEQTKPNDQKVENNIIQNVIVVPENLLQSEFLKQVTVKTSDFERALKLVDVLEFTDEVKFSITEKENMVVSASSETNKILKNQVSVAIVSIDDNNASALMHKDRMKMFNIFDGEFNLMLNTNEEDTNPIMGYVKSDIRDIYAIASAKVETTEGSFEEDNTEKATEKDEPEKVEKTTEETFEEVIEDEEDVDGSEDS